MTGVIDYWCNLFTPEAIRACFAEQEEIRDLFRWWRMEEHLRGYSPREFVGLLDEAGVEMVLIPAAKMRSWKSQRLIWDIPIAEVAEMVEAAPDRIGGLYGINPWSRMEGVRGLDDAVRRQGFLGAHLHPYGFESGETDGAGGGIAYGEKAIRRTPPTG